MANADCTEQRKCTQREREEKVSDGGGDKHTSIIQQQHEESE